MANWANFESNNAVQNAVAREDDDDDFDDFGGFEAAEPVAPAVAQPVPASFAQPSPWATFAAAPTSVGCQPDLIQAQTSSAPKPSPPPELAQLTNHSNGGASHHQPTNFGDFDLELDLGTESDLVAGTPRPGNHGEGQGRHAGSLPPDGATSGTGSLGPTVLGLDIARDTDISRNRHSHQEPEAEPGVSLDLDVNEQTTSQSESANPVAAATAESGANVVENLSVQSSEVTNQENEKLHKELDELEVRKKALEGDLEEVREQLKVQTERYDSMQKCHLVELEEVRKAGHDALAQIVEEYKELVKMSVLRQQEASEKKLKETLEAEAVRCEELMQKQSDQLLKVLEEERKKDEDRLKEALEEQRKEQKARFEEELVLEREKSKEAISLAVLEERDAGLKALETALQAEREKTRQLIQDEREKSGQFLEEERSQSGKRVAEALEEERQKFQEVLSKELESERSRSQESAKEAVEKAQDSIKVYVKEQKQADATLRRKSLAAMDLFLEGARKQMESLMERDNEET